MTNLGWPTDRIAYAIVSKCLYCFLFNIVYNIKRNVFFLCITNDLLSDLQLEVINLKSNDRYKV